ncbi:mCpol domain-containing protein [Stappia sp. P2PMeth1]|uniref:mCpol domain-containing protein n=1 Tax=Stappia sp. P2PMeth1 TaxID=2003586 RepID=UPI0016483E14|nr:mCpol domain-containing protein [Stappia sp. P2PMeth1]
MGETTTHYFCFDGDKVGEKVQLHLMSEDLDGAILFSNRFDAVMNKITEIMEEMSAKCLFRGGDSLIFRGYNDIPDDMIPYKFEDVSFSVGIGTSLQLAALGLFKAKASGRCRIGRIFR